jgi:formylglycine-generating enzyme required for sulfatase activity
MFTTMAFTLSGCAGLTIKPKADYIEPTTGMKFVFVKGGSFEMGDRAEGHVRETPVHTVTLGDFAAGIFEVTFEQYDKFCEATGREKPDDEEWGRDNRPVINVSWEDAKSYAEWLRQESGLNVSLPSESQWEYFARAGTTSRFWTGDTLPKNMANCSDCGSEFDKRMTAPVGSFKPNPWGLFDTGGNVAEWTLDSWHKGYEGTPPDGSAWSNPDNSEKVYRGGAWDYPQKELKSATRDWTDKSSRYNNIGFRLVINGFAPVPKK